VLRLQVCGCCGDWHPVLYGCYGCKRSCFVERDVAPARRTLEHAQCAQCPDCCVALMIDRARPLEQRWTSGGNGTAQRASLWCAENGWFWHGWAICAISSIWGCPSSAAPYSFVHCFPVYAKSSFYLKEKMLSRINYKDQRSKGDQIGPSALRPDVPKS
jgi:hypothetical protein